MPLSLPHLTTGQLVTAADWNDHIDATNSRLQVADLIALTAFGTHTLIAGGTGAQGLTVKNTTAGTGNLARVDVTNDTSNALSLLSLSSTYSTFGYLRASGGVLSADGSGGLAMVATHASSGNLHYYVGSSSSVERMQLNVNGTLILTATSPLSGSNFQPGSGILIDQGSPGASDEALAFKASGLVAHGITGVADTATYGTFNVLSTTDGGLKIRGLTENIIGLDLKGSVSVADTTKTSASNGPINLSASAKSGTGLIALPTASSNLVVIRNEGAGARWMVDIEGDTFRDGTDNTYDAHEDALVALAWEHSMSPKQRVTELFNRFCGDAYGPDKLIEMGILAPKDPATGRHFYNESALLRLCAGGLWQSAIQITELKEQVATLTRRLESDHA